MNLNYITLEEQLEEQTKELNNLKDAMGFFNIFLVFQHKGHD
jgi:hypothetical protein